MRYGVCIGGDASKIKLAKEYGFDYVESCFSLLAVDSDEKFNEFVSELKANDIKAESVNCFMPGSIKTTGENVDLQAAWEYVERGLKRGKEIGLKTVVFGSGGSREIEGDFPYYEAVKQLGAFLKKVVAPLAAKYDVTVVVEPLADCNIITRVKEGVMLAAMADSDRVKGLGDLFHMAKTGDTAEDIRDVKGSLYHAHIAEPSERKYPMNADEWDYKSFIDALEYAGCERCSVEAGTDDFENDAKAAITLLKSL